MLSGKQKDIDGNETKLSENYREFRQNYLHCESFLICKLQLDSD